MHSKAWQSIASTGNQLVHEPVFWCGGIIMGRDFFVSAAIYTCIYIYTY